MLAIKLKIVGRKNQRSFRVIVQEARAKLGGKFVEDIGWVNPHTNQFSLNKERLKYWIEHGAQPTRSAAKVINKSQADSGVETYESRGGRKKKKGDKTGGDEATEAPVAEGAEETPTEGASIEEVPVEANSPAGEEAPAQEETPKEEESKEEVKEETALEPEKKPAEEAATEVIQVEKVEEATPEPEMDAQEEEKPEAEGEKKVSEPEEVKEKDSPLSDSEQVIEDKKEGE